MQNRKRTLPRHTVLAGNGSRFGAFLADITLVFTLLIILFFVVFTKILDPISRPEENAVSNELYNSGLVVGEKGSAKVLSSKTSGFNEYKDALSYYYFNYMMGENIDDDKEANRYASEHTYNVEWFNTSVLQIGVNPDAETDKGLFTYVNGDKTVVGQPKAGADEIEVKKHMENAYVNALTEFYAQDYIISWENKIGFVTTIEVIASFLIPILVFYVLIPLALGEGQTLGKKLFGLALANKAGYKVENWRILLRVIPTVVVALAFLIPIWDSELLIAIVITTIFLASFAFSMASPDKSALHDYCAGTIVIDYKASKLFSNSAEEEKYLLIEDGFTNEDGEVIDGDELKED